MKRIINYVLFAAFFLPFQSFSQLKCPPIGGKKQGDYQKYMITLSAGPTFLNGDISHVDSRMGVAGALKGDYRFFRGLYIGGELQFGTLINKGINYDDTQMPIDFVNRDPRQVKNQYLTGLLNLTFFPFKTFASATNYRGKSNIQLLKEGIYVGAGVGGILNHYKQIYKGLYDHNYNNPMVAPYADIIYNYDANGQIILDPFGNPSIAGFSYEVKNKSKIIPSINAGVSYPILSDQFGKSAFSVVANAQLNFAASEELDGYAPRSKSNKNNDCYQFYSVGLRYSFQ